MKKLEINMKHIPVTKIEIASQEEILNWVKK